MSKWVNADYINDFFDKWEERVKNAEPITIDVVQNVRSILNETPTIEIVRCKDCKHWHEWENGTGSCHRSDIMWVGADYDDYCSFAERMESDEE